MRSFNKVFVVALPRCATVSMCEGLGEMGIKTAHLGKVFGEETPPHNDPTRLERMHEQISADNYDLDVLRECDGLVDYPACICDVFTALDRQFPESLFINIRREDDLDAWLRSVERQFVGLQLIKMGHQATDEEQEFMRVMRNFRERTFGQMEFDPEAYRQAYLQHQAFVSEYFQHRDDDLLDIADISVLEQSGFEALARFFDCEPPAAAFPRANEHSAAPREAFMQAVREGLVKSLTGIEVEL